MSTPVLSLASSSCFPIFVSSSPHELPIRLVCLDREPQPSSSIPLQKLRHEAITRDVHVQFTPAVTAHPQYLGVVSTFLSSAHAFSRKSVPAPPITILLEPSVPQRSRLILLAQAKMQAKEWGNQRGDLEGHPRFFLQVSRQLACAYELQLTTFEGDELLKEGFRLVHAVGRGSAMPPAVVHLAYRGDPASPSFLALVGKGIVFDTGGYNLKTYEGMRHMYADKQGACSTLAAFWALVTLQVPMNLTLTMGFAENMVGPNAYRPADIITSRKGLTVEIGHTDAEGRLVLADCMHYAQTASPVHTLIEESTLTGDVTKALGRRYAGLFTNSTALAEGLIQAGLEADEEVWRLPVDERLRSSLLNGPADLCSRPACDSTSLISTVFLNEFVEPGVEWAHIDIAGVVGAKESSGFGARLLIQFCLNSLSSKQLVPGPCKPAESASEKFLQ